MFELQSILGFCPDSGTSKQNGIRKLCACALLLIAEAGIAAEEVVCLRQQRGCRNTWASGARPRSVAVQWLHMMLAVIVSRVLLTTTVASISLLAYWLAIAVRRTVILARQFRTPPSDNFLLGTLPGCIDRGRSIATHVLSAGFSSR